MGNKLHKWSGKIGRNTTVACVKCECVKELIKGSITYFINDTVYHKAPKCEGNFN